jgi:hypothetical protein
MRSNEEHQYLFAQNCACSFSEPGRDVTEVPFSIDMRARNIPSSEWSVYGEI